MKKGKYILLIFLFFFILLTLTVIAFIYSEFWRAPEVKAGSYLEIELAGSFPELAAPDYLTSLLFGRRPLCVHDVWESLRKAKVDDRIRCVLLRLGYLQCDWAKISEVRDAIQKFRESGKKVFAYIEEAPNSIKNTTWQRPATGSSSIRWGGWESTVSEAGFHFSRKASASWVSKPNSNMSRSSRPPITCSRRRASPRPTS